MTLTMDSEVASKFEVFKNNIASQGEETVFRVFPSKVIQLQALIDTTSTPTSHFHHSHALSHTDTTIYPAPSGSTTGEEPQVKKRKRDDASDQSTATNGTSASSTGPSRCVFTSLVKANKNMSKLHEIIRQESQELATSVDKVKLWVNLTMPKIEDGDNFGVQIQEEVLGELHRAQESAYNLRDTPRGDHLTRAKICSKLIKYPHVEDYALALEDHDEKQHFLARQHLVDIRNLYAVLTDLIHKNINKIRSPKANNSVNLY